MAPLDRSGFDLRQNHCSGRGELGGVVGRHGREIRTSGTGTETLKPDRRVPGDIAGPSDEGTFLCTTSAGIEKVRGGARRRTKSTNRKDRHQQGGDGEETAEVPEVHAPKG
jgi:hypothetical protein